MIAALVPATASAAWTAPTTLSGADVADPTAESAFGGSVLTGWLAPTLSLAKRSGDGFGAPTAITAADPYEKVWGAALDRDGNAVVVTVRRHKPVQRIRATFVAADGTRSATRTISDRTHSAAGLQFAVAPDGTAVAAWDWHDSTGWRAQAAVRRPGQPAFDKPQTLSPPAPVSGRIQTRPVFNVAAGSGGRVALTWQFTNGGAPESPLHVLSAGPDGVFGADQALAGAGGYADVALAVSSDGAVQLAWLDMHFSGRPTNSSLHVVQGIAGAPLSAPTVLSAGGKGTSSGRQVGAAFSADGTATVAWAKPGNRYEQGGTLEVFTRAPGGSFGAAQTVTEDAQGVEVAGGPGASAVIAWMRDVGRKDIRWATEAVTRPSAGGPFSGVETLSAPDRNALWPDVAMTPAGDAVAVWVTNLDGSGGGNPTAALAHVG